MTTAESDLLPCPLCQGGETVSSGNYMHGVDMSSKPRSLISWEIKHRCEKKPGVVAQSINIRGREEVDTVNAWNIRVLSHKESAWLPIESAPKDKVILTAIFKDGELWCARKAKWMDGRWGLFTQDAEAFDYGLFLDPTHWQPLPSWR